MTKCTTNISAFVAPRFYIGLPSVPLVATVSIRGWCFLGVSALSRLIVLVGDASTYPLGRDVIVM